MRIWPMWSPRLRSSRDFLFSLQHPEGYWCGELEADSMLEADYIYLHTQLESGDPERLKRALTEMMRYQNEDGSWSIYPGGPGNISLSVKCYFSAKLMGVGRGRSAAGEVPRVGSGAWRRGGVQHLHQDVSVRAGPVRLRCGAGDSAGDCSFSELVLLQYLRDFVRGRGRFLCRWRLFTRRSRTRRFRRSRGSTSCLWAGGRTRFCACGGIASGCSRGGISLSCWTG